jgi:hypothetical protein
MTQVWDWVGDFWGEQEIEGEEKSFNTEDTEIGRRGR